MVVVFVSKESVPGETRVAATPETVKKMVKAGLQVTVELDAGVAAGFTNPEYEKEGAKIGQRSDLASADLVLSIRPPSESDLGNFKQN